MRNDDLKFIFVATEMATTPPRLLPVPKKAPRQQQCVALALALPQLQIKDDPAYPGLDLAYYPDFLSPETISKTINYLATLEYVPRLGFNEKGPATRNYYHWVADDDNYIYGFSRAHHNALLPHQWSPELVEIRNLVEDQLNKPHGFYNAVLVNYYPTMTSNLTAHRDADPWLEDDPIVASISLGATRTFQLTYNRSAEMPVIGTDSGNKVSLELQSGSLAIMAGKTQKYWMHEILSSKTTTGTFRYNLTFRRILKERSRLQPKVRSPKALAREPALTIVPNTLTDTTN